MLSRMSDGSMSSECSTGGTQFATQGTGQKISIDTFVDRFISYGKKLASRLGSEQEEKLVEKVKNVLRQLADERKRERVFAFLRSTVEKDQSAKATEFFVAWCQLMSLLDENEQVAFRFSGIRLALDVLCTQPVLALYVSELYDQFMKQVQFCDSGQILKLLETHNETLKMMSLSSRWGQTGARTFNKLLLRNFRNLSMSDLVDKFLDEYAFEDIVIEDRRPLLTWKCISLTRVVDNKRLTQILRELVGAWPKRRGVTPAAELVESIHDLIKVAENHPNVGKACFTLFK
ncbi:hypothetical protein GCK32_008223, partial [Trichostrongylus colubriformis]